MPVRKCPHCDGNGPFQELEPNPENPATPAIPAIDGDNSKPKVYIKVRFWRCGECGFVMLFQTK